MEYIEREAALAAMSKHGITKNMRANKAVAALPAADVAPVVHGRWEPIISPYGEIEGWLCACGRESKEMSNYCPKCGAKMDREPACGSGDARD